MVGAFLILAKKEKKNLPHWEKFSSQSDKSDRLLEMLMGSFVHIFFHVFWIV